MRVYGFDRWFVVSLFRIFRSTDYELHRVRKKGTNNILRITSSNTDRFSKFFQCHNLPEICNKTVIKFPTTPQTRRYTNL